MWGVTTTHPLTGVGFLEVPTFLLSSYIPSLVLGLRTPKLPLLPLWEKGEFGGMRGKKLAGTQKAAHLSQ
jgi:hypothetical protein